MLSIIVYGGIIAFIGRVAYMMYIGLFRPNDTSATGLKMARYHHKLEQQKLRQLGQDRSAPVEGAKRVGRTGIWMVCPPAGLWRSYRHGANRRARRTVDAINKK